MSESWEEKKILNKQKNATQVMPKKSLENEKCPKWQMIRKKKLKKSSKVPKTTFKVQHGTFWGPKITMISEVQPIVQSLGPIK